MNGLRPAQIFFEATKQARGQISDPSKGGGRYNLKMLQRHPSLCTLKNSNIRWGIKERYHSLICSLDYPINGTAGMFLSRGI